MPDLTPGPSPEASPGSEPPLVLVLCTGNAARSVMAGAMLADAPVRVMTAGTHVVEGQPIGRRTRLALESVGFAANGHRSHQLTDADLDEADLVVAMAGEHIAYVRRKHSQAASKTSSIRRLCRDLVPGPPSLDARVRALDLGTLVVEPWEDIADPAGSEDEAYYACAEELAGLCSDLAVRLG